jgi:hypothetical protein
VTRGPKGQIRGFVEFAKVQGPRSLLTNPAFLAGAAGIMAQFAMQQTMDEITDYLATIDAKVDDVLRAQKDAVLARMIGVGFVIEEAMAIREKEGQGRSRQTPVPPPVAPTCSGLRAPDRGRPGRGHLRIRSLTLPQPLRLPKCKRPSAGGRPTRNSSAIPLVSLPFTELTRLGVSLPRLLAASTPFAPVSSTLSLASAAASIHRLASEDWRPDSIPSRPWKS